LIAESARSSAFEDIPAAALRRPNTYALIAESVIDLIQDRRLSPGDPIPTERELMERFGAGRSSVREALRVLESQAVIRGDRAGFFIADIHSSLSRSFELVLRLTDGKLRDLMDLRRMIEVVSAQNAARHRTDDDVAALKAANDRWELAVRAASQEEYAIDAAMDTDLELHLRIAQAGANATVVAVMYALRDVTAHAYRTLIATPNIRSVVADQHSAIITAIAAQDPEQAGEAMRAHILHVESRLGALLDGPLYT
jgi:DNA-binding FadR family transcriptional regulator